MLCCIARSLCLPLALCFTPAGCAEGERERSAGEGRAAKENAGEEYVARETPWGPVRVELSAPAKEYILGQAIPLTLVVTNERNAPMRFRKVNIDRGEWRQFYVSTDGKQFERREEGNNLIPNYGYEIDSLAPGASRQYRMRILYSWRAAENLTFSVPGRYWIRLDYPLLVVGEGPAETSDVPSNAIEVRITEPTGVDADVFAVLRDKPILRFMSGYGASPGTVKKVLDLIKKYPKSSYDADMKAVLESYYRIATKHQMSQVRSDPEWKGVVEEVRVWLGVARPEDLPFPDDKRLSVKFTYSFQSGISFKDLCAEASRLTKVPLSVAPELADRTTYGAYHDREVRRVMRNLALDEREWIRDGDGYKLVPKPKDKAAPAESPR